MDRMESDLESESDCPPLILDTEQNGDMTLSQQDIQFSLWNTFKSHIPRVLLTLLIDVILPFIIYLLLQKHLKPVLALMAAGMPPFFMVIVKATLSRTFDALGFLVFIAFLASAIAALITHNPIIILLEKSLVTGLISVIFGITLVPFHYCCYRCQMRPLAYYFYKDLVPTSRAQVGLPDILFIDEQINEDNESVLIPTLTIKQEVNQVYEWIYTHCSSFRLSCHLITIIWSIGLLLEFLARLILILKALPIDKIFIYGHLILGFMTCLLILLTIICITNERKKTLKLIREWKKTYLNI